MQSDVVSLPAQQLMALLRNVPDASSDPSAKLLIDWDGAVTKDSAAAAVYELWLTELVTAVTHRATPPQVWDMLRGRGIDRILSTLAHPAADVFGEQPEMERNKLLLDTLKSARAKLVKLEGADPSKWAWGRIHIVEFRHPLDQLPGAKPLFDLGPVNRPGDDDTVNATGYEEDSFRQVAGASYREIMDLSDWDHSVAVNVPGESGQPGSTHYADLLPLWSEGHYFPLSFSRQTVEKYAVDQLVLQPESPQ